MKLLRLPFALLCAPFVVAVLVAASACGGGQDVPPDAVAVVDGTEIPRSELDELIDRAKRTYTSQGQQFPTVGTPEYLNVQAQYVKFLVQVEEFEKEAEKRGIEVTEKEVDAELSKFVAAQFEGKRAELLKALKKEKLTLEKFRESLRLSVLSRKLFDDAAKEIEVTQQEIVQYYQANQASYGKPESRTVRHILVSEKNGDEVDYAASKQEADRLYQELQDGADFAKLAKAESADTTSAVRGGELTVNRGETVPEFDKLAFELERREISKPVKTSFGYHIIQALSPVRKATTTPLGKVRASIRATLLQDKKSEFITDWIQDLDEEYADQVSYAAGFEPPELPEDTETETETDDTE